MLQNTLRFTPHSIGALLSHQSARAQKSPFYFITSVNCCWQSVLSVAGDVLIEVSPWVSLQRAQQFINKQQPDFALSVTSRTLYQHNIALPLAHAIRRRFGLSNAQEEDIATCLQEAIQNAIIHGNLGIKANYHDGRGLEYYYKLIQRVLNKEPFYHRHVTICAWQRHDVVTIAVTDQGQGFDPAKLQTQQNSHKAYGRGLKLIADLCHAMRITNNTNCTIYMDFA